MTMSMVRDPGPPQEVVVVAAQRARQAVLRADPHDTRPVQGDWIPVQAQLGGQPLPDTVLKTIRLKLGEGTYDVSVGGAPDQGTFEVDASTTPKRMVIRGTVGPNKDRTIPAIYEIESDTLRICYDLSGAQHPAEFNSPAGTKLYLVSYARKKSPQ